MSELVELVGNGGSKQNDEHPHPSVIHHRESTIRRSLSEVVMGGVDDPYNKPELINTLKGRELCLFVIFYACAVFAIVLMFEFLKPVLFNPNYPEYE